MDSLPPIWRLRIYFSKTSSTWRLEQDDGSELEYDEKKGTWILLVRYKVPFLRRLCTYSNTVRRPDFSAASSLCSRRSRRKCRSRSSDIGLLLILCRYLPRPSFIGSRRNAKPKTTHQRLLPPPKAPPTSTERQILRNGNPKTQPCM